MRAAGQKELLRYGPTADRVKRGAASFGMIALRDSSFVPVDIASSRNSPNCGERLEAQGGTLLASHGPDLDAVNRRSSAMMLSTALPAVLRTQVVDDSVDERPLDIDEYPQ